MDLGKSKFAKHVGAQIDTIALWVQIIGVTVLIVVLWLGPLGWMNAFMTVNTIYYGFLIAAVDNAHKYHAGTMSNFIWPGWQVAAALAGNAPGLAQSLFFSGSGDRSLIPQVIWYSCTNTVDTWRCTLYAGAACDEPRSMAQWSQDPALFAKFLNGIEQEIMLQSKPDGDTEIHALACATWNKVTFDVGGASEAVKFLETCGTHKKSDEKKCQPSSYLSAGITAGVAGFMMVAFPGVGILAAAGIAAVSAVAAGATTAWKDNCFN
jgi:hypothetical protein